MTADCHDWDKPEVARAQFELVRQELSGNLMEIPPYKAFVDAMRSLGSVKLGSIADVGCGVGHYSAIVDELFP